MPIGSRSYYDSVGSGDKKQNGSKPGLFRKGDQPASTSPAASTAKAPAPSAAAGPAKKRRSAGAQRPRPYVPPLPAAAAAPPAQAVPMDGVVAQIVDLASRVGSVLAQAEDAVKRAEQLLASAASAASRSEAAALRAELAASRTQLSTLTAADGLDATAHSGQAPSPEPSSALQDMLRSGMLQLDKIGTTDSHGSENGSSSGDAITEDTAASEHAEAPSFGVPSDGPQAEFGAAGAAGAKGGMSAGAVQRDRVVGRASRHLERTERSTRESVAHGLVTFHHESEIPRVSPFILGLSADAGQQTGAADQGKDDPGSIQDPPRKIGLAV